MSENNENTTEYTTDNGSYTGSYDGGSYQIPSYSSAPVQNNTMAIWSLVLGIISIVCCCWFGVLGMIVPIIGLVLGIIVLVQKKDGKGLAIAGVVCSGLSILFAILSIVILLALESADFNVNGVHYDSYADFFNAIENGEVDLDGDFSIDL